MLEVSERLILERREFGHDRWDEVWEGELHMVPPPHGNHGRLEGKLFAFFDANWEAVGLGRVYLETGVMRLGATSQDVAGKLVPSDYRTPDLSFLLPERYDRFQGGWIVGGPDVALEILSPGDESRDKLPFYFSTGVREVAFVDRDSYEVEVFVARSSGFERVLGVAGWVASVVLGAELRRDADPSGRPLLRLRRSAEPSRVVTIGV